MTVTSIDFNTLLQIKELKFLWS